MHLFWKILLFNPEVVLGVDSEIEILFDAVDIGKINAY